MKKIITLVVLMLFTFSVTAQKEEAQKTQKDDFQKCYLEAAEATFNLAAENIDKLFIKFLDEKLGHRTEVRKKIKSGELTKEEGKTQMKEVNQRYFKSVAILTDKTKTEIMAFEKKTNKKCRKK